MSKPKFNSDEEFADWVESPEGRDLIHKQFDDAKKRSAAPGGPGKHCGHPIEQT